MVAKPVPSGFTVKNQSPRPAVYGNCGNEILAPTPSFPFDLSGTATTKRCALDDFGFLGGEWGDRVRFSGCGKITLNM